MQHHLLDPDTLNLLRESLARYAREQYGFEQRRKRLASAAGFGLDAWQDYAQMGWLSIAASADHGGFDSAPEAIGALMHYVGSSLALEPVFASAVLCGRLFGLAGADPVAEEALQNLAEGQTVYALAHAEDASDGMLGEVGVVWNGSCLSGRKLVVLHGDSAAQLLVTARDSAGALGLFLVEASQAQVQRSSYRLVDGRGAANVSFAGAPARRVADGQDVEKMLALALDDARLALCAEAHGASQALNAITLAYLKERRQFGRPIGTNQALQHRMVELYMLQEEGRSAINSAYRAKREARRTAIFAALAQVMTLGRQASHEAVQMHGGIGVTEELAVSHYFRRLMVVNRLLGDRELHVRQFAAALDPAG